MRPFQGITTREFTHRKWRCRGGGIKNLNKTICLWRKSIGKCVNSKPRQIEPQTFPPCINQCAAGELASRLCSLSCQSYNVGESSVFLLCAALQPLPEGRADIVVIYLQLVEGGKVALYTGREELCRLPCDYLLHVEALGKFEVFWNPTPEWPLISMEEVLKGRGGKRSKTIRNHIIEISTRL